MAHSTSNPAHPEAFPRASVGRVRLPLLLESLLLLPG